MSDDTRTTFTASEGNEIRQLLAELPAAPRAVQRMTTARLRRIGLTIASHSTDLPTLQEFDEAVAAGTLRIDSDGGTAKALIRPKSGRVFRVAVGVTGESVEPTWSAFDSRYQWFTTRPQSVVSGDHLFVLAVDRWRSAVVGLYETVTAGADKMPDSPDENRWPWALGVRPLAAISPPSAIRVEGQTGPQSGLPAHIHDEEAIERLYQAVAHSPPPPGPTTLEQQVQEVEWRDVVPDVLQAIETLGTKAREPAVVARAIELGGWSNEEMAARAWYTGSGVNSHVEHICRRALQIETGSKGRLQRVHGIYTISPSAVADGGIGVPYRPRDRAKQTDSTLHVVDLAELERATKRHMDLQDRLAETLVARGVEPRSPASWEPQFDVAFEDEGKLYVVEIKSGSPVSAQQMRLGSGQALEYRHLLSHNASMDVRAVVMVEGKPPPPWMQLAARLGIRLLCADQLEPSLSELLSSAPGDDHL
jgi:hypothetical protein